MDKPTTHDKPATHAPGKPTTAPAKGAGHKPPGAGSKGAKPIDGGQRVGGYSAVSGWFLGLVAGVIVMGMTGLRPAWLFLAVGLPVVGVSFYMASFLGGRLTKGWLPPGGGSH